jgi:hypothetical protein
MRVFAERNNFARPAALRGPLFRATAIDPMTIQRKPGCACGGSCPHCQNIEPSREQLKEELCVGVSPGDGPERCEFTPHEMRRLVAMRFAAQGLTSRALMILSRGDPHLTTIARRVFHVQDPDMAAIRDTVSGILEKLINTPIECGTCSDETCHDAAVPAYTMNDLSAIVLCRRFFRMSLTDMRRTLIHEAGHATGMDLARTTEESYCREDHAVECVDPCGNLTGSLLGNVDAWARFIECAGFTL